MNKQKGNFFLLPNKIFDEGLTPMEFVVYSFLTSRGDAKGMSYYSVPNIAKYCSMCENSCRKAIRGLTEKGYVDVRKGILKAQGRVICIRYTKYEPPPVQQTVTNN